MRIFGSRLIVVSAISTCFSQAWNPSGRMTWRKRVSASGTTQKVQHSSLSLLSATETTVSHSERLSDWQIPGNLPQVLVFDLDNTLWTPELYQIQRNRKQVPVANKDIRLFDGVLDILKFISSRDEFHDVQLAVASRTNKGDWARQLLQDFAIHSDNDTSLQDVLDHVEIYTGSKRRHFEALKTESGRKFSDMVFFDDDLHLNLNEVSQMGVFCSHCPHGLTIDLFMSTLDEYSELVSKHSRGNWMGHIVNSQTLGLAPTILADEGRRTTGVVKFYNAAKRFGFVRELNSNKEFFFHESKVAEGVVVERGTKVEFETLVDGRGRPAAAILANLGGVSSSSKADANLVTMHCFSMSQPFVALLLNGVKMVETRNHPMFRNVAPGTRVLLHCGRRDWRDLEAPKVELRKSGYSEPDIIRLSRLPIGMSKGEIVGVLTIGRTWESTLQERESSELQRQTVANKEDMGQICTAISNPQWLNRSVSARGNPGIYQVQVPMDCLPPNV